MAWPMTFRAETPCSVGTSSPVVRMRRSRSRYWVSGTRLSNGRYSIMKPHILSRPEPEARCPSVKIKRPQGGGAGEGGVVSMRCLVGSLSWRRPRADSKAPPPCRSLRLFQARWQTPASDINILWIIWGYGPRACADRSFASRPGTRYRAFKVPCFHRAHRRRLGVVKRWGMTALTDLIRQKLARRTRRMIEADGLTRAAVLIPLLVQDGTPLVLFTRRTDTVQHHKGQISFPGGATEQGDVDALATALRETEEEVGIPPGIVEVLGTLDDVHATVSGFLITPFVGIISDPVPLRINTAEIAEVLSVPLSMFRDASRLRMERRERGGQQVDVYFYTHGRYEIWGVTARIMKSFIDAVFGESPP